MMARLWRLSFSLYLLIPGYFLFGQESSQKNSVVETLAIEEPTFTIVHQHYLNSLEAQGLNDIEQAIYELEKAVQILAEIDYDETEEGKRKYYEVGWLILSNYQFIINGVDEIEDSPLMMLKMELEILAESYNDTIEIIIPENVVKSPFNINFNEISLVTNKRVDRMIHYFRGKGKRFFRRWMERSGRYIPMMRQILREEGVPEQLVYLSMIESGFNPKAYSYAHAAGLWQFVKRTGIAYGLDGDWWYDDRNDPEKSTRAAAKHLKELYEAFGDWYLAMAAYNVNPKKVSRATRIHKTKDFWKLKKLPRQTRDYIPKFIAASLIAKNPEAYGFDDIEYQKPVEYGLVFVDNCTDLKVVADIVRSNYEMMKILNPAIKRWCTPPGVKNFPLHLPAGVDSLFTAEYAKIPDSKKTSWRRHRIGHGESLSVISEKYHVSMRAVKDVNRIRNSHRIVAGKYLLIPVPPNKKYYSDYQNKKKIRKRYSVTKPPKNVPNHRKVIYIVKKDDTLGHIAEAYFTSARNIRYWNGLRFRDHIFPDQRLVLWIPRSNPDQADQLSKISAH